MKTYRMALYAVVLTLGIVGFSHSAAAQVPDSFTIAFTDGYLVVDPTSGDMQLAGEGMVLSYGEGLEMVQLKPFLYHIRRSNWSGYYWKVNTSRREAYLVTGGVFGQLGGTEKPLDDVTVDVVGGVGDTVPDRFFLRFRKLKLVYAPPSDTLQIISENTVLSYGDDWEVAKLKDYLYHLRLKTWSDIFFKVNTSRKEIWKVSGGVFGSLGGSSAPMSAVVLVKGGEEEGEADVVMEPVPIPLGPIMSIRPDEDCISFDPSHVSVIEAGGSYKLAEGDMWMVDFGDNAAEADKAFQIIRHYSMDSQCFVGRPDASLMYWTVGGGAPEGAYPGEDCVGFDPDAVEAKYISGRWKVVDGDHWLFDFDQQEDEARLTVEIIRFYGFDKSCFVGRPNASFTYMRK
ncbi:MAG: hypothetical protein JW885_06340 [Deltaproteobacteria bacterium]|nr:hypothetical protein [Candidatus Zymogenaceae bacterium]